MAASPFVWEPFAIAVVFGLVVSAGLYFIVMWPQVEPADDDDDEPTASAPPDRVAPTAEAKPEAAAEAATIADDQPAAN